jgi:hypothetical protein
MDASKLHEMLDKIAVQSRHDECDMKRYPDMAFSIPQGRPPQYPGGILGVSQRAIVPDALDSFRMKKMIGSRLRWPENEPAPFDFLECHMAASKALVFAVVNGEPVTLEDDPALFPSDTLVTQIRLLQKEKK